MDGTAAAKEAIWKELQPLMEQQLTDGPLSDGDLRRMERLSAALNALGTPEVNGRSGALLNAFQQLSLIRVIQEDSRKELRRLARLLEHRTQKQPVKVRLGFVFGIVALWIGLSILLFFTLRFLDELTIQFLCAGALSALALAVFACEKQWEDDDMDWLDEGDEDEDWEP